LTLRAIHYDFIQKFNVPAQRAFAWCTDYGPDDMALMKMENAMRKVQRIADDVVILIDTFVDDTGKKIEKQKLVCLYPTRLTWTSTHLTGPNKHSQFLYKIEDLNNEKSQLRFTALSLDYEIERRGGSEKRGKELRKIDAGNWELLAWEMEKEINRKK
jgi:hypothetical protein